MTSTESLNTTFSALADPTRRGAGLIARGREAQWRPCRLEAGPLKDATDWLLSYQSFWKGSLDALESYLGETKPRSKKK
jgi:hypothetical protein